MAANVLLPIHLAQALAPAPGEAVDIPISRDPFLPTTGKPLKYADIFVNNFVSLGQFPNTRRRREMLLYSIAHVF